MDVVLRILERYRTIKEKIKSYIILFNSVYQEAYTTVMLINNDVKTIENNLASILPKNLSTSDDIFYVENIISIIEEKINSIVNLFDNEETLNNNVNKTMLINMEVIRNWINKTVNSSVYLSDHNNLIHKFIETIKEDDIKHIEFLYNKYNSTIKLYVHYLYQLSSDPILYKNADIECRIERLKYTTINKIEVENKLYSHSTRLNIQRYNLYPLHQGLQERKVIDIFFHMKNNFMKGGAESNTVTVDSVRNKLEALHTISLEKKCGVFLMIRVNTKPVSYDFSATSTMEITNNAGVSNESIEKNTFIKQNISGYSNILNTNIKFGYPDASSWLIIRTIDNSTYDIYGDIKQNIVHNRIVIDKIERGSSLLIDTYNKVNAYKFAAFIKPPIPVIVDNASIKYINTTKSVILSLKTEIERKIDSGMNNVNELYEAITGVWINQYIQKTLLNEVKTNGEIISSSVLSDTFKLSSSILKFIDEDVARLDIDKDIFSNNTMQYIINFAKKSISTIITKSVEKAMPINSNIYEKIYIRKSLLNIN